MVLVFLVGGIVAAPAEYQPFLCTYAAESRTLEVLRDAWVAEHNTTDVPFVTNDNTTTIWWSLCGLSLEFECNPGDENVTACRMTPTANDSTSVASEGVMWRSGASIGSGFDDFGMDISTPINYDCLSNGHENFINFVCDPGEVGLGYREITLRTLCDDRMTWYTALACDLPTVSTTSGTTSATTAATATPTATSNPTEDGSGGDGGGSSTGLIAGIAGGAGGIVFIVCIAVCLCIPLGLLVLLALLCCLVAVVVVLVIVVVVVVAAALGVGGAFAGRKIMKSESEYSSEDEEMGSVRMKKSGSSLSLISSTNAITARSVDAGEFKRIKLIGQGAFGKVYLGKWNKTTAVAIKEVDIARASNREEIEREVGIMSGLGNHPHVVNFIGQWIDEDAQTLFIVTAFYPNGSLHDYLVKNAANHAEPTETELMCMARDAAAGVLFLHQRKVIHRDIAMRNCLVTAEKRVAVSDFGTSRIVEEGEDAGYTANLIMAVRWMAPECFDRVNKYDNGEATSAKAKFSTTTDVWAFGVMLYEMWTRRLPYDGTPLADVSVGVRDHTLELAWPPAMDIPQPIVDLRRRCMAWDPATRATMEEVFRTLSTILGEPAGSDDDDSTVSDSNNHTGMPISVQYSSVNPSVRSDGYGPPAPPSEVPAPVLRDSHYSVPAAVPMHSSSHYSEPAGVQDGSSIVRKGQPTK